MAYSVGIPSYSSSTPVAAVLPSTTSSIFYNHGTLTSVAYSTQRVTVTSCAASVTNCPARSTSVYASLLPYSSYVCKPTTVTVTTTKTVGGVVADPTGTSKATASPLTQLTYWTPAKPLGGPDSHKYEYPAWIPTDCDLTPGLPQNKTNGNSVLGTKDAPTYSGYLPGNHGGNQSATGTNPYKDVPNTGVTRKYKLVVSYKDIAPDGVTKKGLVINGGFPGPTLEANWGDDLEIEVENQLTDEGTAIHWHGLLQKGTQYFDGVPSVQQCPIVPGKTLTYKFKADMYGTSWYHSHYSAQYAGGALGALIIHGPKHGDYDEDLGPVILSDWYHSSYYELVQATMGSTTGRPPPSQNNLINGKMNYPCANTTRTCVPNAGISKFFVKSGKKYLLRLINTSSDAMQKFSIDGHKFTVVSQDFVPIKPYDSDLITLGVGQRADVIVEAVGKAKDAFWIRSTLGVGPTSCSLADGTSPNALAALYYEGADSNAAPTTNTTITLAQIETCANDALTKQEPLFPLAAAPVGQLATQELHINFTNNGTAFVWTVDDVAFRGDYSLSLLDEVQKGTLQAKKEWAVKDFGNNGTIRIVLYNHFPFATHPMHLHGHDFQILAEGTGVWDGTITNPSNPARRDVQILGKADANTGAPGYTVIQFEADNPGVWPLHCHVAWHVSAGLYVNILERPADLKNLKIPQAVKDTCADWKVFSAAVTPNQIDSGL